MEIKEFICDFLKEYYPNEKDYKIVPFAENFNKDVKDNRTIYFSELINFFTGKKSVPPEPFFSDSGDIIDNFYSRFLIFRILNSDENMYITGYKVVFKTDILPPLSQEQLLQP